MSRGIGLPGTVQLKHALCASRLAPTRAAPRRLVGPALLSLLLALTAPPYQAQAEIYPRVATAEGTVVAHKTGEEAQFVDLPAWRPVDIDQDLLAGDTLRTNADGNLTIRFADKTLVRMGRNTTLVVKKIGAASDSVLGLTEGNIWARAARGGTSLEIETPAAAAAIRGTDWTLRVSGNQTVLTVLEGAVSLTNKQGSVLVRQGEGATATLGQAPRKYTLVNLREREQILLYNELRDNFTDLPTSGLDGPRSRAERRRILAAAPGTRSASDWLMLAETALSLTGREEARKAMAEARRHRLARSEAARARLVEAMLAGQEMRYAEAAELFAAALPALPQNRRATAAYGLWFARSLATPDKALPPPSETAYADDPAAALARADAVAHLQGQAEAIKVLEAAEKRFPDDARLPAARAALAFELDRREEVKAALKRALSLDPDDPSALLTSAQFRSTVSSDLDGALADLRHAAAVAPGDSGILNEIGLTQSARNAPVEADRAHRKAIALNPENAAIRANYARFLMDNDQMGAAKREIDIAEKLDPNGYAVLAAKGRYLLRMGRTAEGEKALLSASAVNPTYGDALIGLAIASYQLDAVEETQQALDNADRFDRNNPSVSLIRSAVAIDQFQADEAILQAREALRRRQLRGGYYTGYDANRQASSYLGITLENLGMDEWGTYYKDRAFDPFMATSYADQAGTSAIIPFVTVAPNGLSRNLESTTRPALNFQANLLDPLFVALETGKSSLERRQFFEGTLSGSLVDQGGRMNWANSLLLQGTNYSAVPVSYALSGDISRSKTDRDNDLSDIRTGSFDLGFRPTLQDSVVLFGATYDLIDRYPGQTIAPTPHDESRLKGNVFGAAWSHIIDERNIIQLYAGADESTSWDRYRLFEGEAPTDLEYRYNDTFKRSSRSFGINHILGIGPVTLRYGTEAYQENGRSDSLELQVASDTYNSTSGHFSDFSSRSYADALVEISRDLQVQSGLYMVRTDGESGKWGLLDPRFGIAWAPAEGQWLRAFWRQDTAFGSSYTLSPITTVGLSPMDLPLYNGGQARTFGLRWDAEWNSRFFTSVEYRHDRFNGLSLAPDDARDPFYSNRGKIDRLTFSSNIWLGGGLGTFGSFSLNRSDDMTYGWDGGQLPLVPDYFGQVGLRYVHPSRVTTTVAQNFVGQRVGQQNLDGSLLYLDPFTTTDAAISWTTENRKADVTFSITNIFDTQVKSANYMPAPGRTVMLSLTSRF